jgi:hypothetical protein
MSNLYLLEKTIDRGFYIEHFGNLIWYSLTIVPVMAVLGVTVGATISV